MSAPLKIFCCYARKDQELLKILITHLMSLQRQGVIKIWSDTNINAGVEWEKELHQHLESADIILLLISADFINSEYCYSTEMKRAIERHDQGSAHVIPILLRHVRWQGAPFAKLQVLPTNARPVKSWPDIDEAFHDITEHIHQVVCDLQIRQALIEADEHIHAERFLVALAYYERVLSLDQQNGQALFGRARTLYLSEQIDASIEAFTLAEQTAPASENAISYIYKADALNQRERYTESLATYDRALSLEPSNTEIHAKKAKILIKQEEYEQALSALEQAMRLNPNKAEYVTQTGKLLFQLRRFEQALTIYKQASQLQPGEASHYKWQGKILLHLQRYGDALAAYKQALDIVPEAYSYEQAGKICLQLARYQEALEMYEQAMRTTNEDNPYLYAGKGQAFLNLERYDEALSCYQSAIKLSAPDTDPQFYHDLGKLHQCLAQRAYDMEKQRRVVWQPETEPDMFLVPTGPAAFTLLRTLTSDIGSVYRVSWNGDGTLLASGSDDTTVMVWEVSSGRKLRTFTGPISIGGSMSWNGDGSLYASRGYDNTIKVWEVSSGREIQTLTGHTDMVYSMSWNGDGSLLASASGDNTIKLWEVSSGREIRTFTGHTSAVHSVSWNGDGSLLASGSDDGTVKVWEVPSGREIRTLTGHTGVVWSVSWNADGNLLASASGDNTIKVWGMES